MSITIRRTKHLDECDFDRIDFRNEAIMTLLNHKIVMRANDTIEGSHQIEEAFSWCKQNCTDFYSIRGPDADLSDGTIKYYLYFMDENDLTLFAISFPRNIDENEE